MACTSSAGPSPSTEQSPGPPWVVALLWMAAAVAIPYAVSVVIDRTIEPRTDEGLVGLVLLILLLGVALAVGIGLRPLLRIQALFSR